MFFELVVTPNEQIRVLLSLFVDMKIKTWTLVINKVFQSAKKKIKVPNVNYERYINNRTYVHNKQLSNNPQEQECNFSEDILLMCIIRLVAVFKVETYSSSLLLQS